MRLNLGPQARNLFQQTTDIVPFVFRLSRMVSAIITFDIVTQTAKEILKSKGWRKSRYNVRVPRKSSLYLCNIVRLKF